MRIETLHSLTDDELCLLWGCVNICEPSTRLYQLDYELFTSIKHNRLMQKLQRCRKNIKEDHVPLFDGLINKLGLT